MPKGHHWFELLGASRDSMFDYRMRLESTVANLKAILGMMPEIYQSITQVKFAFRTPDWDMFDQRCWKPLESGLCRPFRSSERDLSHSQLRSLESELCGLSIAVHNALGWGRACRLSEGIFWGGMDDLQVSYFFNRVFVWLNNKRTTSMISYHVVPVVFSEYKEMQAQAMTSKKSNSFFL